MEEKTTLGRITGTWGGILTGFAAILTAVGLNITDTSGERAQKADDKSELVLDLIKGQFKFAEKERDRISKELEYQRGINAKLFQMVSELRGMDQKNIIPEVRHSVKPIAVPKKPVCEEEEAADELTTPEPYIEESMEQLEALPENLEDMLSKK